MFLREATPRDAAQILSVYAPYIQQTAITFEYETPTLDDFTKRIISILQCYPYFICEENGQVIGYAYASPQHERKAYGWNADTSIYLQKGWQGKHIGKALYSALLAALRAQGCYHAYALITQPNARSMGLHQALGFTNLGLLPHTGFKQGQWHDVAYLGKDLQPLSSPLQDVVPYHSLPLSVRETILKEAESLIRR